MSLRRARHQKTAQAELPLEARGEALQGQRSGEAPTAAKGNERSGNDRLMEKVVERGNVKAALKRVRQNKGSPGIDGMRIPAHADQRFRSKPITDSGACRSRFRSMPITIPV